jgi:hypothetical protein
MLMTDQELKDLVASLAIESKKTDEQMKETDRRFKETEAQMNRTSIKLDKLLESHKRLGKMVGGISNSQGEVAEEFFVNSIAPHQCIGGIKYDMMYPNLSKIKDNLQDEYDIVLVNGKDIAIIEVKYKAHEKDVIKIVKQKYENFKKLYPEYSNYKHHLGLASFKISDDVKQEALRQNIMVLQRKGDVVETFLPKI